MSSTYVQITRQEFEAWLDTIGFRGRWQIKPGRGGVYQMFLSPQVMVEINSTTGSGSAVMSRGRASMSLRLVSRITGRTLNKKAMGQRHFARTTNWRSNWARGVDRMVTAYESARGWYDQIAKISDRERYKVERMGAIEGIPGWDGDDFLRSLHSRLGGGGVLTERQEAALTRRLGQSVTTYGLERLRELYRRARASGDQWVVRFVGDAGQRIKAGRSLTQRQREVLDEMLRQYNLHGGDHPRPYPV